MSNVAGSCGGPSIGIATPQLTLPLPCGITIVLPSFGFSIPFPPQLPSAAFFLKFFFNLNICNLSVAFDLSAGAAVAPFGGCIQNCVPDPSLSEQTLAAA